MSFDGQSFEKKGQPLINEGRPVDRYIFSLSRREADLLSTNNEKKLSFYQRFPEKVLPFHSLWSTPRHQKPALIQPIFSHPLSLVMQATPAPECARGAACTQRGTQRGAAESGKAAGRQGECICVRRLRAGGLSGAARRMVARDVRSVWARVPWASVRARLRGHAASQRGNFGEI